MRLSIPVVLLSAASAGILAHEQPVNEPSSYEWSSSPHPQQQQQYPLLRPAPALSENIANTEDRGAISEETYDLLKHFAKYASAVYQFLCPRPLGNTLVRSFSNALTHAHGFVARDDGRREIVVAFRGSQELANMVADGNIMLVPLVSRGIEKDNTAFVHAGFLISYNSVRATVIRAVRDQLHAFPGYAVAITGHSLGGALASIAALSVKSNLPSAVVRLYTYGQPRTGDAAYADLLETTVGRERIFRGIRPYLGCRPFHGFRADEPPNAPLTDGVPTMIPESLGYCHHVYEYWQFEEPPNSSTVRRCEGREDPACSHSIPSTGINLPHVVYFGQAMRMDASLCL